MRSTSRCAVSQLLLLGTTMCGSTTEQSSDPIHACLQSAAAALFVAVLLLLLQQLLLPLRLAAAVRQRTPAITGVLLTNISN